MKINDLNEAGWADFFKMFGRGAEKGSEKINPKKIEPTLGAGGELTGAEKLKNAIKKREAEAAAAAAAKKPGSAVATTPVKQPPPGSAVATTKPVKPGTSVTPVKPASQEVGPAIIRQPMKDINPVPNRGAGADKAGKTGMGGAAEKIKDPSNLARKLATGAGAVAIPTAIVAALNAADDEKADKAKLDRENKAGSEIGAGYAKAAAAGSNNGSAADAPANGSAAASRSASAGSGNGSASNKAADDELARITNLANITDPSNIDPYNPATDPTLQAGYDELKKDAPAAPSDKDAARAARWREEDLASMRQGMDIKPVGTTDQPTNTEYKGEPITRGLKLEPSVIASEPVDVRSQSAQQNDPMMEPQPDAKPTQIGIPKSADSDIPSTAVRTTSGDPIRTGSGGYFRSRTQDEIAADMKRPFGMRESALDSIMDLAGLNKHKKEITESTMNLDMKHMLNLLSESTKMADIKGKKHSGSYGSDYKDDDADSDDEPKSTKKSTEKKKVGGQETTANKDAAKWKGADDAASAIIGGAPPKAGVKGTKHGMTANEKETKKKEKASLKDWVDTTEEMIAERAKNKYAIGMDQAMKSTGDKPPLKKSTITKAHEIAKKVHEASDTGQAEIWTAASGIPAPSAMDEPAGRSKATPMTKSATELDFDRRAKADKGGMLPAERGGVFGATKPPADSQYAPGDRRNSIPMTTKKLKEDEENSFVCVHAKKGKCEVKAKTSYEAAKKAAAKWNMKSTAGIDTHRADKPIHVDEAKDKKAKKDYDGDGKIESGKDEYLGSKIAAAKKAGKLKEGAIKDLFTALLDKLESGNERGYDIHDAVNNGDEQGFEKIVRRHLNHDVFFDSIPHAMKEQLIDAAREEYFSNQSLDEMMMGPMIEDMSSGFDRGTIVYWRGKPGRIDRVQGDKCFVHTGGGNMDVWPTEECSTKKQSAVGTLARDVADIGRGLGRFSTGRKEVDEDELSAGVNTSPKASISGMNVMPSSKNIDPGMTKMPPATNKPFDTSKITYKEGNTMKSQNKKLGEAGVRILQRGTMDAGISPPNMTSADRTEYNRQSAANPNASSAALDQASKMDRYNKMQRQSRDQNDLSIGQWAEKGINKIKSAVTGKPEQPVSYQAYRFDKTDNVGQPTARDEITPPAAGVDEGNAFTGALANARLNGIQKGETMRVGKQTYPVRESDEQMESWDDQLKSMLNESLTISTTQGNDQTEDSVSVTASGPQAQDIMALLRNAGIGGMGNGEESAEKEQQFSNYGLPMSGDDNALVVVGEPETQGGDMLAMMKKMAGLSNHEEEGSDDYADEEGSDETCESCGMNETSCECDHEMVDETFPTAPNQQGQMGQPAQQGQTGQNNTAASVIAASAPQQPTTGATQNQQVTTENETYNQETEEVAEQRHNPEEDDEDYDDEDEEENYRVGVHRQKRVDDEDLDEAVRALKYSMTGMRPPETQPERDELASQIKKGRASNRADPTVTGYGNRVAPQKGIESGQKNTYMTKTDNHGQAEYSGRDIDPKHAGYAGKLRVPAGAGKGVAENATDGDDAMGRPDQFDEDAASLADLHKDVNFTAKGHGYQDTEGTFYDRTGNPRLNPEKQKEMEKTRTYPAYSPNTGMYPDRSVPGKFDESLANGADDQADQDLDFMINTISGGLNKRKTMHKHGYRQNDNPLGSPMKESTDLLSDFRKLSGLK